jgi:DNA-binding MarR family transcriptional regulator
MKIEDEIHQKNFNSEWHKLHVNILFTASWIGQRSISILKPYGISRQQFNILRILKGRFPSPASVKLISERMIDKMSNTSRLIDKLKSKKLVDRAECPEDRRQVNIIITSKGMELIDNAGLAMENYMNQSIQNLNETEAIALNLLLDRFRENDKK